MKPVFLFSLPRSGSTLIQRVLALHSQIDTVSEPWILLPYLYSLKKEGICAEYGHFMLQEAVSDFCNKLPNGQEDYLAEMRMFVLNLYRHASSSNSIYFLDKTPRYHLIVNEVFQLFPQEKYIFLWRHPLALIASIIDTWADGKWNLFRYEVDLFQGLGNLIDAYSRNQDISYSLRYEDFLLNQEDELKKIYQYLDLPSDLSFRLTDVPELKGRWGNPPKAKKYKTLSKDPLNKWKATLSNPLRKAWCKKYLMWIGKDRLKIMSYELDELLDELTTIPTDFRSVHSDMIRMTYGYSHEKMKNAAKHILLSKKERQAIAR